MEEQVLGIQSIEVGKDTCYLLLPVILSTSEVRVHEGRKINESTAESTDEMTCS